MSNCRDSFGTYFEENQAAGNRAIAPFLLAPLAGNGLPHLQRSAAILPDRARPLLGCWPMGRPLELLGKVHAHGKRWPAARGFFRAGVLVPHVPGRGFRLAGQMSRMQHGSGAAGKT